MDCGYWVHHKFQKENIKMWLSSVRILEAFEKKILGFELQTKFQELLYQRIYSSLKIKKCKIYISNLYTFFPNIYPGGEGGGVSMHPQFSIIEAGSTVIKLNFSK